MFIRKNSYSFIGLFATVSMQPTYIELISTFIEESKMCMWLVTGAVFCSVVIDGFGILQEVTYPAVGSEAWSGDWYYANWTVITHYDNGNLMYLVTSSGVFVGLCIVYVIVLRCGKRCGMDTVRVLLLGVFIGVSSDIAMIRFVAVFPHRGFRILVHFCTAIVVILVVYAFSHVVGKFRGRMPSISGPAGNLNDSTSASVAANPPAALPPILLRSSSVPSDCAMEPHFLSTGQQSLRVPPPVPLKPSMPSDHVNPNLKKSPHVGIDMTEQTVKSQRIKKAEQLVEQMYSITLLMVSFIGDYILLPLFIAVWIAVKLMFQIPVYVHEKLCEPFHYLSCNVLRRNDICMIFNGLVLMLSLFSLAILVHIFGLTDEVIFCFKVFGYYAIFLGTSMWRIVYCLEDCESISNNRDNRNTRMGPVMVQLRKSTITTSGDTYSYLLHNQGTKHLVFKVYACNYNDYSVIPDFGFLEAGASTQLTVHQKKVPGAVKSGRLEIRVSPLRKDQIVVDGATTSDESLIVPIFVTRFAKT